jgi:general secretion pathway protein G
MKYNIVTKNVKKNGFTLLEIMMVLAIIAVITGGAIYALTGALESAKIKQCTTDFSAIQSALDMYRLNAGTYPTTQQGLISLCEKPKQSPIPKRWTQLMKMEPKDPWGNNYKYYNPGRTNTNEIEIVSLGVDKTENTDDDISSQN